MKSHEDICVFYQSQPTFNPIMEERGRIRKKGGGRASDNFGLTPSISFNNIYYPQSILRFPTGSRQDHNHPTQKPVALGSYLIRTYSNPGDVVLDNATGSGTFGVSAIQEGRRFIGIERDPNYFAIASARIAAAKAARASLLFA